MFIYFEYIKFKIIYNYRFKKMEKRNYYRAQK